VKTGVESIAKARKGIRRGRDMKVEQIIGNVRHAEVCSIIGNPHTGLEALAEAGALIDMCSGTKTGQLVMVNDPVALSVLKLL
jgi:hypothetical protein